MERETALARSSQALQGMERLRLVLDAIAQGGSAASQSVDDLRSFSGIHDALSEIQAIQVSLGACRPEEPARADSAPGGTISGPALPEGSPIGRSPGCPAGVDRRRGFSASSQSWTKIRGPASRPGPVLHLFAEAGWEGMPTTTSDVFRDSLDGGSNPCGSALPGAARLPGRDPGPRGSAAAAVPGEDGRFASRTFSEPQGFRLVGGAGAGAGRQPCRETTAARAAAKARGGEPGTVVSIDFSSGILSADHLAIAGQVFNQHFTLAAGGGDRAPPRPALHVPEPRASSRRAKRSWCSRLGRSKRCGLRSRRLVPDPRRRTGRGERELGLLLAPAAPEAARQGDAHLPGLGSSVQVDLGKSRTTRLSAIRW